VSFETAVSLVKDEQGRSNVQNNATPSGLKINTMEMATIMPSLRDLEVAEDNSWFVGKPKIQG
jgi:hypothetical protein